MLQAEFPNARQCDAEVRAAECVQMVHVEMIDQLDAERLRGQLYIVERLWDQAGAEGRDGLTAAIHLAREVLGHGGVIDLRAKKFAQQLKGMSREEIAELIAQLSALITPPAEVLTLGGTA